MNYNKNIKNINIHLSQLILKSLFLQQMNFLLRSGEMMHQLIINFNFNVKMYQSQKNYEDHMPQLMPLDRKTSNNKQSRVQPQETYRSKAEENPKSPMVDPDLAIDKLNVFKSETDKIIPKRSQQKKRNFRQPDIKKRNEISKNLINQMINKISLKSITEQNYPVSNQTIQRLMIDLDEQIEVLNRQITKMENSLMMNPTNAHLKKQLQDLQKSMNQTRTIKDLYIEKIDNRNKISDLQSKIMELKSQNRQLKIKIARGIQKIQSHIHNLPCEKEKKLIEEVNKYKLSLDRQKEMRQNLQNNISSIVLNFKRFYVEADEARKIVTQKLQLIDQKEHELNLKLVNFELQKQNKAGIGSTDGKSLMLGSNQGVSQIFVRQRRTTTNRFGQDQNMAELINQNKQDRIQMQGDTHKGKSSSIPVNQLGSTILGRQGDTFRSKFNLEQQIAKMRTNQMQFSKISKRKS